jgi:hypothetical protein
MQSYKGFFEEDGQIGKSGSLYYKLKKVSISSLAKHYPDTDSFRRKKQVDDINYFMRVFPTDYKDTESSTNLGVRLMRYYALANQWVLPSRTDKCPVSEFMTPPQRPQKELSKGPLATNIDYALKRETEKENPLVKTYQSWEEQIQLPIDILKNLDELYQETIDEICFLKYTKQILSEMIHADPTIKAYLQSIVFGILEAGRFSEFKNFKDEIYDHPINYSPRDLKKIKKLRKACRRVNKMRHLLLDALIFLTMWRNPSIPELFSLAKFFDGPCKIFVSLLQKCSARKRSLELLWSCGDGISACNLPEDSSLLEAISAMGN